MKSQTGPCLSKQAAPMPNRLSVWIGASGNSEVCSREGDARQGYCEVQHSLREQEPRAPPPDKRGKPCDATAPKPRRIAPAQSSAALSLRTLDRPQDR